MNKKDVEFLELKKQLRKVECLHLSYDYVKISLLSPKKIKRWATRLTTKGYVLGEVLSPETMYFRNNNQPVPEGLFCQAIFGPIESWKCGCGKYSGVQLNKICEFCHCELTDARVRRYRMGYIDLIVPVTHLWYLKGTPSYIHLLLSYYYYRFTKLVHQQEEEQAERQAEEQGEEDPVIQKTQFEPFSMADLEEIVYIRRGCNFILDPNHFLYSFLFSGWDVAQTDVNPLLNSTSEENFRYDTSEMMYNIPLSFREDMRNSPRYASSQKRLEKIKPKKLSEDEQRIRFGAELIQVALDTLPLKFAIAELRTDLRKKELLFFEPRKLHNKQFLKIIRIMESFLSTKTNPSSMILTTLSVLPPNLRPLVELENGHLVSADINEIYRLVIIRNKRLFDFLYVWKAPDLITAQSRKLLQEVVDCLIDNGRVAKNKQMALNDTALKGLTEILEGKTGRFRQTLLGKRVDYSGRSVIIVGPSLRLNQCGLPYEMGMELFHPFLMKEILQLKKNNRTPNFKSASLILSRNKPFVWKLLEKITQKNTVLLNRAPTLHRFGIQAFDPVLVLGQAIHLHPLVCTGFNADFDGDQMALHLPLYKVSQFEAKTMMRPSYHVLSPSNGDVILKPTQDMVMGCYYLTLMIHKQKEIVRKWFSNENQALQAFYMKKITLQTPLLVRYPVDSFLLEFQGQTISLRENSSELELTKKNLSLLKCYCLNEKKKTYALITNVGVFLALAVNSCEFQVTDIFLETSVGRLIFNSNYKNSLQKGNYVY